MGAGHTHALYVHEHSRIHRLAAEVKVAAALGFVLAVAVTPREVVWALAVDAAALVAVSVLARVPLRFLLVRLLVAAPFVAFALLIPFVASGERVEVVGLSVSREGLWGAFNVLAKATLGATTSILLAATTEIPRILRGLERLRVPSPFTAIAQFMFRYLEVVAGELGRTRTAMTARGYDPRWLWQLRPLAAGVGGLFVRSFERGERVHAAMLARGYTGTMPSLDHTVTSRADWLVAATLPLVAAVVAALAWSVR